MGAGMKSSGGTGEWRGRIGERVLALESRLVETRRELHRHPELAHEERRTAEHVASHLRALGVSVREGVGGTGVVGLIEGEGDGPTVLFRADMDALPLTEETGLPFASEVPGVMHACGHDAHVAIALGLAELLSADRSFGGRVKLMFQPAEEGERGALLMIEGGVLEDPVPDVAFALHACTDFEVGRVGVRHGTAFAGCRDFRIVLRGRGGHGAMPHQADDVVLAAAQVVTLLQSAVARRVDPMEPAVVTVGRLHAGTKSSIIPEEAEIVGTVRAHSSEVMEQLHEEVARIARGVAEAAGCSMEIEQATPYPPVVNHPDWSRRVEAVAADWLGADRVGPELLNGSEDMSHVMERVPGCYFLVGARNTERGIVHPHHSPRFDIDEGCLLVGTELAHRVVLDALSRAERG